MKSDFNLISLFKSKSIFNSKSARLSLWVAAALMVGCASSNLEKGYYDNSKPKYSIEMDKEGRKSGTEIWWHPDGQKKYEAVNRAGLREGKFTAWYPDGTMWYQGFEIHGKPESTLTYWYPNGRMKSQALFRDGIQLERKDYDEQGRFIVPKLLAGKESFLGPEDEEVASDGASKLRQASLQMWAVRVRQTVESFWVLPKEFEKQRPYRSVAKIKVGRDGKILGVSWSEKSPSASFNTLAQNTFKRVKKLPPFPPQVKDQTLDVQYEFISLGKPTPRKKLEARDSTEADTGLPE